MLRHSLEHAKYRTLLRSSISKIEPLLVEVLHEGKLGHELPTLEQMRAQRIDDVSALDPGIRRLVNPHVYHVSLSQNLWDLKQQLIEEAMQQNT